MKYLITTLLLFIISFTGFTQSLEQTANDKVIPYDGYFGYGVNMGYYPPWLDEQLADIAAGNPALGVEGVGVNTIRPGLFEHFLEQWGYDIRLPQFTHYENIGLIDNVAIIGYPSKEHRDTSFYCYKFQSELFANIYTDIWDNGENGTPVNDENYYALYLYKMVSRYKDLIRFWEIWNEPDFDWSNTAWKPRGEPGNWFDNDPNPCDYALRAPVYYYNRMLRISYEVIKKLDPDGYVCIGGLGYPGYLDAVMRTTDNPVDGSVTDEYPLYGGAYFEVMSFHSYPHIDGSLREWDNGTNGFVHFRHSDAAVDGVVRLKKEFEDILMSYGYNGTKYPNKIYINTECNIPRKAFNEFIGSHVAQYNFLIKVLVEAQANDIQQFHVYNLGESMSFEEAESEFHLMGFYKNLNGVQPYTQEINTSGVAYKTVSNQLYGSRYDAKRTAELKLPVGTRGGAFVDPYGFYTYVIWATTSKDRSEEATADYSFPASFNLAKLNKKEWDFSQSKTVSQISPQDIALTGTPIMLTDASANKLPLPSNRIVDFIYNHVDGASFLNFKINKSSKVSLELFNTAGDLVKTYYQEQSMEKGNYKAVIDSSLPPGIYLYRIQIDHKEFYKKILKQ